MKVIELRAILDHLPDDLDVCVSGHGMLAHLRHVLRTPAHKHRWAGSPLDGTPVPGQVRLLSFGYSVFTEPDVGWWLPAPSVRLSGPFRRQAALDARLDGLRMVGP
jgi:hypothetical protein